MSEATEFAAALDRESPLQGKPVLKYDKGKAPVWRGVMAYFPRALEYIARVSEFGANKYSWGGWAKVADKDREDRYADALARHFTEMGKHGMYAVDPETKRMHIEQLTWNGLALIELYARKVEAVLAPPNGADVLGLNSTPPSPVSQDVDIVGLRQAGWDVIGDIEIKHR